MAQEKNRRREFLVRSAQSLAVYSASVSLSSSMTGCSSLPVSATANWSLRRQQFDLDPHSVHLAPFLLTSLPRPVKNRIETLRTAIDKNPASFLSENEAALESMNRQAVARFVGVAPEYGLSGVSLVGNTTQALEIVYSGLIAKQSLQKRDEILTTASEHFSSKEGLSRLARASSARLIEVDPLATNFLDNVEKKITRHTRLVSMTWVHSETGVKLPLKEVGALISSVNSKRKEDQRILFLVDGVHALGTEALNIPSLNCDYFAAGCHKALHGPRGTGFLWTSEFGKTKLLPTQPSFVDKTAWQEWRAGKARSWVTTAEALTPGGYVNYESRWALHSAFEFHEALGRDTIQTHIAELASRLRIALTEIPEMKVITPLENARSSSIVCWNCTKMANPELLKRLAERGIYGSLSPYRSRLGRFAVGIANTKEEIDHLISTLKEILRS